MTKLPDIIALVENIPPFPKVAQRVLTMLRDPDISVQELAKVIQFDQAITANVLKLCNAAYFGLSRKVSSLEEALVVLGQNALRDIIMTSSSSRFYKEDTQGYELGQGELWQHSIATAIIARILVRHIPGVDAGVAYNAALLHDIGKVFLSSFVADEFRKILLKVVKENCSFVAAEMEVLGMNHAELGGLILEKWNFAPEMITAVRQHHDPQVLGKDPLSALVALSNALTVSMGIGVGADGLATRLQGEGLARFGIEQETLDRAMVDSFLQVEEAKELMSLV